MKVLVTGADGQLGYELARSAPAGAEVVLTARRTLDITDVTAVAAFVAQTQPTVIINAAAYTAVDRAESEPEQAFAVNAAGAGHLAQAAAPCGAYLVQVSTDFVFDGHASRPYPPEAAPAPLGVYGASKADGERRVREALGAQALILRTAWVYSAHGGNFVKTMLRLMDERDSLNVVADQVGTPTWACGLAAAIWRAVERRLGGTYHWTDAGVASWYDFACAIEELGRSAGLLVKPVLIHAIRTEDYPTSARRPAYSLLDKTAVVRALDLEPPHWRAALERMLIELPAGKR